MTSALTPEQIDAMFERLNPLTTEERLDATLGDIWRRDEKREGFRQAWQARDAEIAELRKQLRAEYPHCEKHGCLMTQTITDDVFCGVCRTAELRKQLERMTSAIRQTLEENGHLADGDVCTLRVLKDALPPQPPQPASSQGEG